jgi:hypothetical protein
MRRSGFAGGTSDDYYRDLRPEGIFAEYRAAK